MNEAKPSCKYGNTCYRRNPQHLEQFHHGSPDDDSSENLVDSTAEKKKPTDKGKQLKTKTTEMKEAEKKTQKAETLSKKRHSLDDFFDKANSSDSVPGGDVFNAKRHKISTDGKHCFSAVDSDHVARVAEDFTVIDAREDIKRMFLVEMPEDFYEFWDFAKSIDVSNPSEALVSSIGLQLVGPYDVLAGKTQRLKGNKEQPNYLRHWRYYYDPPEFMTVLRGDDNTQFHIGYFRDDPKEMPAFVASNKAAEDCSIKPRGENIFAAVSGYIDELIKQSSSKSKNLSELQNQLKQRAAAKNLTLDQRTSGMKAREKKVVSKTFHGAGIVVKVDKNGVGYRPLPESPTELRKILKKIIDSKTQEDRDKNFDALTEIVTLVQFANDECDYGEGLELGIDLFCYGGEQLHGTILGLLPLAYQLLGRREYSDFITAHLADRRRGPPSAFNELVDS